MDVARKTIQLRYNECGLFLFAQPQSLRECGSVGLFAALHLYELLQKLRASAVQMGATAAR